MSDAQRPLPPKKDVALALLSREPSVYIHLDPRRPGVAVPRSFMGQPQLVLQIGMNMTIPIPDLKVDEEGISCTLSFNRSPFWCRIPWLAIWALVGEGQRAMVWPEDVPPELMVQKPKSPTPTSSAQKPEKPGKRPRPRLAAVKPEGDTSERSAAVEAEAGAEPGAAPGADEGGSTSTPGAGAGTPNQVPRGLRAVPAPGGARSPAAAAAEDGNEGGAGATRTAGDKPKRELPPYLRVIK